MDWIGCEKKKKKKKRKKRRIRKERRERRERKKGSNMLSNPEYGFSTTATEAAERFAGEIRGMVGEFTFLLFTLLYVKFMILFFFFFLSFSGASAT